MGGERRRRFALLPSFLPVALAVATYEGWMGEKTRGEITRNFPPSQHSPYPPFLLKRPQKIFLMMPTHMSFAYLGNTRCDLCVMRGEKKIKSGEILSRFFCFSIDSPLDIGGGAGKGFIDKPEIFASGLFRLRKHCCLPGCLIHRSQRLRLLGILFRVTTKVKSAEKKLQHRSGNENRPPDPAYSHNSSNNTKLRKGEWGNRQRRDGGCRCWGKGGTQKKFSLAFFCASCLAKAWCLCV